MNGEKYIYDAEIDIMQLFRLLLQHWWQIGLLTVLGLAMGAFVGYGMKEDVYTAHSSMIVQVTNTTDSDYTALLTGQRLVDTYAEIAKSDRVMNELKDNLSLTLSKGTLRSMISVSSTTDTLIINLNVTSPNPALAQKVANETVNIVKQLSYEFDGLEDVEILDIAELPTSPSGPNHMMYAIIGLLLGGMTGVGLVILVEFLDKNVKTAQDLEQKVGIRVLGAIPDYSLEEVNKHAKV